MINNEEDAENLVQAIKFKLKTIEGFSDLDVEIFYVLFIKITTLFILNGFPIKDRRFWAALRAIADMYQQADETPKR